MDEKHIITAMEVVINSGFIEEVDLGSLREINNSMKALVDGAQQQWEYIHSERFGDMRWLHLLVTQAGIDAPFVSPDDWHAHYVNRCSLSESDLKQVTMKASADFKEAEAAMVRFNELGQQEEHSSNYREGTSTSIEEEDKTRLLSLAARLALGVIDMIPDHSQAFYVLAYTCLMANAADIADTLCDVGIAIDDGNVELKGLKSDLVALFANEAKSEGLLIHGELSPAFTAALRIIFKRFDVDGDGALCFTELRELIRTTSNGATSISLSLFNAFVRNYGGSSRGLSEEGFASFYLQQTRDDAEETWSDIAVHGFERNGAWLLDPLASSLSNELVINE